ncbi:Rib/alpha-like domain-containing protein, partial [Granulicatella elegans]|uniref:Rib/alpha-like domain-containing protein n=1 Tax=Granulicatella elegans TaxID=137732 RepID=UPI0028D7D16D
MFFYNKNQQVNEKRQKFSIRKYKVGTFSVVVGALFYLNGISNMVQATEAPETTPAISIEEKQSGESKKAEEPQQPKVQEAVNTTVTQPAVTEKTEIETKKETSKAEVKQGDVAVDSMTEHPAAASKVETKPVEENKETQKESAENEAFIQELNQVLLEGKSLESNVHVAFRLEVEQLVKEMEEATKNSKSITKETIEQFKEKIQNLKKKNDEYQNGLNEKVNKIKALQEEINSISSSIQYTLEPQETALLKVAGEFSVSRQTVEEADGLITSLKQLRNKVANRMTRAHSGKRDPRNGQPINGNGESRFRAVYFLPTQNQHGRGEAGLVNETRTDLTYYNSDEIYSFMRVLGQRGPGEPLYKYEYGENRGKEDKSPYYLKTVGVISGLDKLKGITLRVAYKNPRTGKEDFQDITSGVWPVNNPEVKAVIRGWLGRYDKTGEAVEPGDYRVTIAAGRKNPENSITYTFHVKAQSERNTVNDLATKTYVDDVRHLTEPEKKDLIKKFEDAHPGVVNRPVHVDYDHAEVSADGATMTIHFKDGFAPKTIQTNAQNDAIAKHQNITALYGDPHDFYKNPRNFVKSITGNELPSTVDVTWKTPFNLQQPGIRKADVTVTYQNGTVKDVSTPYTVLDFVGKQDKRINQHQSGELGDARSYITLSNGTAPATDLTIRWKGGSTVDTSRPTVHHKQIEILRGNTTMKTVDIPVEIVDNIRPTVEIPYDNPGSQEIYLYSHENNNITLKAKDNNGKVSKVYLAFAADNRQGLGQEDSSYLGGGIPDGLYLTATKIKSETTGSDAQPATITVSGNINNQPFTGEKSITRYLYTEDPAGNTNYEHVGHANDNGAPGRVRFVWKPQTFKYTATANSQTQTVSYKDEPSAEASINKTGLPSGTTYVWKTKPDTSSPGNKSGVVEVTYPDTSKDTVNVTVNVRKLSDEYKPTGDKIVRNQNTPVTNDDLKAAVTISNNGNSKVKSVTPVGTISTATAGTTTIKATVTYLDNTTDPVDIPLEVKDVTPPTIQTPSDRQNWDLIALDRILPSITVTSVDNNGGTGVKSTTVTGLPDFLVYDNATKTIKFKNGVQEVTKLPAGQDSKTYTATIEVTDNANNPSQRQFTITVKSMTTKYNATPNGQKQTVSYGATPDAGTSINKNGLPAGTTYTWVTTPSTTAGPGDKAGSVTVTYPDGSTDTVNVTVNVRRLADEYAPTGTKITKNQNESVSNEDLKAAVTINNNGNNKVKSVTPVGTISTATAGTSKIKATVTYLDNTTDPVDITLEVKDKTAPTITTPTEGQLWEITSLDKTLPSIKIAATDNPGGSGVKSIEARNLPSFLKYDKATSSIVFQDGVNEVPKLSGISRTTRNVTFIVEDNAGNRSERNIQIRQISMAEKYNPQANTTVQEVSHGELPNPKTSVNTVDLPGDTRYTWSTTPDTSKPGDKTTVVTVTYPDDSVDEVTTIVKVRKLSDEYNVTGAKIEVNQNEKVTSDMLKGTVTATNAQGENRNSKISKVESKTPINTEAYGDQKIQAKVTYIDGSEQDVTIPLKVKDVTDPTIQSPAENTNWEMTALDKTLPSMKIEAKDNEKGSGIATIEANNMPSFLTFDQASGTIVFKEGVQQVPKIEYDNIMYGVTITARDKAGNSTSIFVNITVWSMRGKYTPTAIAQEVDNGHVPDPEASVNKTGLPDGTTVTWKTTPDVSTPGSHPGVALVHYPDGTEDEV